MPRRFGFSGMGAGRRARQFDASILWANALAIGRDNSVDPVDKFYNGFFAHLQITKGVARHTAAFSQITAPHARPEIKGVVTGDSDEPLARRIVAFNRKTLAITGQTTSTR